MLTVSQNWSTRNESNAWREYGHQHQQNAFAQQFYKAYIPTIQTALIENDWNLADRLLDELTQYQIQNI